jgi:hypothetical protein
LTRRIVPIVEGHGEVEAVPILLRRLLQAFGRDDLLNEIHHPQRKKRYLIVKNGQLEKEIHRASLLPGCKAIIVLLDCDEDCAAELGPSLSLRARQARSDLHIEVVIAVREYESWLIGGASSLAGKGGLPADLQPHGDPESVTNPKAWLDSQMGQRAYLETDDQPALTSEFNICAAYRRSASFRHFCKAVKRIAVGLPPPSSDLGTLSYLIGRYSPTTTPLI